MAPNLPEAWVTVTQAAEMLDRDPQVVLDAVAAGLVRQTDEGVVEMGQVLAALSPAADLPTDEPVE